MELYVGTYSTHVFDFTIEIGIICFIALVVMLVYWNHKRKQHRARYQPSGQHASVVQRQNNKSHTRFPAFNKHNAGSTPAARINKMKEGNTMGREISKYELIELVTNGLTAFVEAEAILHLTKDTYSEQEYIRMLQAMKQDLSIRLEQK